MIYCNIVYYIIPDSIMMCYMILCYIIAYFSILQYHGVLCFVVLHSMSHTLHYIFYTLCSLLYGGFRK